MKVKSDIEHIAIKVDIGHTISFNRSVDWKFVHAVLKHLP